MVEGPNRHHHQSKVEGPNRHHHRGGWLGENKHCGLGGVGESIIFEQPAKNLSV